MTREDFRFLAEFCKLRSGLSFDEGKTELIESRLKPLVERRGLATMAALIDELRSGNEALARAVSEAMTIRDTSFFRDGAAFDAFRDQIVPVLMRDRMAQRRLRLWCAAAATGQEPYSLAMVLDGLRPLSDWNVEIVATDASAEAMARASAGVYSHTQVQRGLPVPLLARYFQQDGDCWRIAAALRNRVRFRVFNLLDSFADIGPFDVIFCRNVLIYFDQRTKTDILARLRETLAPGGYLVLGAGETVLGLNSSFAARSDCPGIYVKTARAQAHPTAAMG
jgi:chemotaxis protein methyltransferase CheR